MKEIHFKALLKKHLQGQTSKKEKDQIEAFENQLINKNTSKVFTSYKHKEEIRINIYKAISAKINKPKYSWIRVAASIAIIMGLTISGLIYKQTLISKNNYLSVTSGEHPRYYILPDSSSVWLNKHTQLKYATNFTENRNILLEGEAFFIVKKNQQHPFKVNFANNKLEVTGTQFNINSFNTLKQEVSVKEGSVKVTANKKTYPLKSNDYLKITKTSTAKQKKIFLQHNYYNPGELIFDKTPMAEVINIIANRYGQKIRIKNISDQELALRISAKYKSDINIFDLINGLTLITPFTYEINIQQQELIIK